MRSAIVSLLVTFLLISLWLSLKAAAASGIPMIVPALGVTAFDSETLKPHWQAQLGEVIHAPVIASGLVIVSNSSGITAIESSSGALRWRLNDRADWFSAVLDGELAYLASAAGELRAVDTGDGRGVWKTQFSGWVYPPAVLNQQLYTGGNAGKLWALDRSNGALRWERELDQEMVYRPVVAGGSHIIVTTFAKEVLAFSPQGVLLWRTRLPAVVSSPQVIDDLLVFGGLDQSLYGLDRDTGGLRWRRPLGERLQPPMVVNQGELIAVLDDGRLISVDGHTGGIQELSRVSGELIAPPYLRGDRIILFLRSLHGPEVITINRRTGEQSIKEI